VCCVYIYEEKELKEGSVSFTLSSTQRKCTDRQNLLFSTLAPGIEFVLFNRALYTWEKKFHN
jgi:hypothetical protein